MENPKPPQEKENTEPLSLSEKEKEKIINTVRDEVKKEVGAVIKKDIRTDLIKWCLRWWIISIPALMGIIGFWFGVELTRPAIERYITQSITEKFAESNIKKTLTDVASTKAESIISDEIRPETKKAKQQIASFETYLNEKEEQYDIDYDKLAKQVSSLEDRDNLMQLSDDAINNGDRQAYEKLSIVANDASKGESIRNAAKAEWFQVKRFYIGLTRLKGMNLAKWQSDGTKIDVKNDDLTTQELIQSLLNHNLWTVRAMSASALSKRKEKGVPEALLQAIRLDQSLDVVKEAIDSFESITGYTCSDIFDSEGGASEWWEQHKTEVEPELKEQSQTQVQEGESQQ